MKDFLIHACCTGLLLTSGLTVIAPNPIHSVLSLLGTFALSAMLMFLYGASYLAFTYIIVYMGAIMVLFLFVIMMLKIEARVPLIPKQLAFSILFALCMAANLYVAISDKYFYITESVSPFSDLQTFGILLYNHLYFIVVQLANILLIALVGVITLAHDSIGAYTSKRQNITIQHARPTQKIISFKQFENSKPTGSHDKINKEKIDSNAKLF
jgi:NADH-quinone oxidoreductase subunit J